MKKLPGKHSLRRDLIDCHWTGRVLGMVSQRLNCAGGDINQGNLASAEHHIFQAKSELEDSSWVLGKSTSKRLIKLLDDPYQALKKAHRQIREGKPGRVSRGRLYPAEKALARVMRRASKKCE